MRDTITIIKDRIKNILNQRNMKIYELAKLSDVSEACIRNWYSKRNYVPSLPSLINICKVLDINLSMLVMTEDEEYCPIDNESKKLLIDFLYAFNSFLVVKLDKLRMVNTPLSP